MQTPSLHLKPFEAMPGSTLELRTRVRHRGDLVEFEFLLSGSLLDLERVVWPDALAPSRRVRKDELWKTTCLELFIGKVGSPAYFEMNLSPAGDWNLYEFDEYRTGMRLGAGDVVLHASPKEADGYRRLVGAIRPAVASPLERWLRERELEFSATAVIETAAGERQYWALTHAGAKPDFHLRSSFTGRLSKPASPASVT